MAANADAMKKFRTVLDLIDDEVLLMMDGDPKNYDLTVDQAFNLLKLQQYFLRKAINKYVVPMQRSMVFTTDPSPATAKEETLDFSWLE